MRIKRAREIAGLSLGQAATMIAVHPEFLADLENHYRADLTAFEPILQKLAKIYGTSVAWLRGAEPVLPESFKKLMDEQGDKLSWHDRAILTETIGFWNTKDPA